MQRYIQLYSFERITTPVTDFDRWKYTRKNWFTDQLWKLLHKLGCLSNPVDDKTSYKRVVVDTHSVANAVLEVMDSIHYMYGTPKKVYMGPEEFDRHLSDSDYHREMSYNFTIPLSQNRHIFNLPVEVVPHMEGILVV